MQQAPQCSNSTWARVVGFGPLESSRARFQRARICNSRVGNVPHGNVLKAPGLFTCTPDDSCVGSVEDSGSGPFARRCICAVCTRGEFARISWADSRSSRAPGTTLSALGHAGYRRLCRVVWGSWVCRDGPVDSCPRPGGVVSVGLFSPAAGGHRFAQAVAAACRPRRWKKRYASGGCPFWAKPREQNC